MSTVAIKNYLSRHTHITVGLFFCAVALFTFIVRGGKGAYDNWSDPVFFAELVGLCATSMLLCCLYRFLPQTHVLLPWLLATILIILVVVYVYLTIPQDLALPPSFNDLIHSFGSYGFWRLHFFGLLERATPPGGESTRAAFLDTQLIMAGGFALGLGLQKRFAAKHGRSKS